MSNFIGAIVGDTCGSVYEWNNAKEYDAIQFFNEGIKPTDDSVLSCAVADWLASTNGGTDSNQKEVLINRLRTYGHKFPNAGYGRKFKGWLNSENTDPIGSCGNGAGMRCSACGYVAKTYEEALDLAKKSAEVTHNHEEGIKGAQAIAGAVWMARQGWDKSDIKSKIEEDFGYDLNRRVDDIHGSHKFDATCQVTVPEAIIAFLEADDFEECFYKAIWIGGDSDTVACMACAIGGAYYGVPSYIAEAVWATLPKELKDAIKKFEDYVSL